MTFAAARTMKLPGSSELSLGWGERLALSNTSPDVTHVLDLTKWPLTSRPIHGFFASSMARAKSGRVFALGRHYHQNPYRLYELDLATASVTPRPLHAPWHEPLSVFTVGDRVLLVPGGTLRVNGFRPSWWRESGDIEPLDLTMPALPSPIEHQGARYLMPDRMDRVDVIALPDDEALLIWFERLYRIGRDGVTPLALDGLFAMWEPLREGRHGGLDDRGRALAVIDDLFLALDREGNFELASPGSWPVKGTAPGPDGLWFLTADESLHVVFTREREVLEVDLRPMRLAPRMSLFVPKAMWVPSRDAVLVTHSHDAHEFDLSTLRAAKRVSFEKHAKQLASSRRSLWNRKVKAAGAPISLDALSQHTRGGGAVEHPTYGVGAVTHVSEARRADALTVRATVLFEDRNRSFVFVGDRWAEVAPDFA